MTGRQAIKLGGICLMAYFSKKEKPKQRIRAGARLVFNPVKKTTTLYYTPYAKQSVWVYNSIEWRKYKVVECEELGGVLLVEEPTV